MAANNVDLWYIDWSYLLILILSSIFVRVALTKYGKNSSSPSTPQPPSPLPLPVIGHIHLLGSVLPRSFQTLARRYGPFMRIRMGSSLTFLVGSSPDVARQILKPDVNFSSRFELGPVQYSIYQQGMGFITSPYSPYYRFMKKLCTTKLFVGSQLNQFRHIREHEVRDCLRSVSESSVGGDACNLTAKLTTLMNNLIFRMIMGRRYDKYVDDEVKQIKELVVEIMELGSKCGIYEVFGPLKKYDLFGHGKKLRAAMVRYDDVLEKIIADYEVGDGACRGSGDDLMDILLKTSRDVDAEVKLTNNHIKQFILEMLIASIDTTSAALQWTMAELINHHRVFMKLREEIESTVGPSRLMSESDFPNLPYLQAVVKESLRLHTPTPLIFRECTKDCKINGYKVKAGTKIFLNTYAIMRDPETWQDPDEFVPERFLVNAEGSQLDQAELMKGQDFGSYLPFGGGRRACIGAMHASAVIQATVGALIQCFDWKIKDGDKVDITVGSGFSGAMARPLVCYPVVHSDPFK
ncbi:cytochrome P450 93A3-like [Punica granatum]|nr:cytochrome P450 93A3-like [Punica granatum]PKI72203.1 hypothetical protein CRG98_007401 [Punica granatum]